MEYIYAAMLVHSAGKEVTEESISEVLGSAGVEIDDSRVKALVAALEDVDIEEAIESGQMAQAAAAPATETAEATEEKDEEEAEEETEEEKDEEEAEEEAAEGLGALFQ